MRAKLMIFVLRSCMISEQLSFLCAEGSDASCFDAFEADGPDPPMHEKTSGQKFAFSTSVIFFMFVHFIRLIVHVGLLTAFRAVFLPAG